MSDAPEEIWVFPHYDGGPFSWETGGWEDHSDIGPDVVKYIRADIAEARIEQLEAERDAAHKRGLEDAAKAVAEECDCAYAAKAIRAMMQERDE